MKAKLKDIIKKKQIKVGISIRMDDDLLMALKKKLKRDGITLTGFFTAISKSYSAE